MIFRTLPTAESRLSSIQALHQHRHIQVHGDWEEFQWQRKSRVPSLKDIRMTILRDRVPNINAEVHTRNKVLPIKLWRPSSKASRVEVKTFFLRDPGSKLYGLG